MDYKDQKTSKLSEHVMQIVRTEHPETLKQLVELVQQEHPLPQQEIIEHILHLQNQGKMTFQEGTTLIPLTLKSYLLSSHSYWFWVIIALALATTTTVFVIPENTFPIIYARYLVGTAFVIFLPGYSFIKALFSTKELDNIERTGLSIGMSLALVSIIGLLLNYTSWGIRTTPVTLSLLVLTTVFATAALIREYEAALEAQEDQRHIPSISNRKQSAAV